MPSRRAVSMILSGPTARPRRAKGTLRDPSSASRSLMGPRNARSAFAGFHTPTGVSSVSGSSLSMEARVKEGSASGARAASATTGLKALPG